MIATDYEMRCRESSDIADHLPRLYTEAAIGNAQVIELGVRSGNSTAAFLAAVIKHGGHVWSVDIHNPQVPPEWFGFEQWSFILGDDLANEHLLPWDVDVLFIDTSHHYNQTLLELGTFGPHLRPGGVILLHDTELECPYDAPAGDPPFPVRQAVVDYCETHGFDYELVEGCNGLGVIRIPGGD